MINKALRIQTSDNALAGEVGPGTNMSGYPPLQEKWFPVPKLPLIRLISG
jgi:hypothetical protein